jgi:hypothetical protein
MTPTLTTRARPPASNTSGAAGYIRSRGPTFYRQDQVLTCERSIGRIPMRDSAPNAFGQRSSTKKISPSLRASSKLQADPSRESDAAFCRGLCLQWAHIMRRHSRHLALPRETNCSIPSTLSRSTDPTTSIRHSSRYASRTSANSALGFMFGSMATTGRLMSNGECRTELARSWS